MFTVATVVVNNRPAKDARVNDTITNPYSANDAPTASGDVSVDGIANTVNVNRCVNISQSVPAADAVGECKHVTETLPAEYGRSDGSFMNIVIKSGTNDLLARPTSSSTMPRSRPIPFTITVRVCGWPGTSPTDRILGRRSDFPT